jgi:hypothetical protein
VELAQEQEDVGAAVRQGLIEFKDNPFARAGLLEQAGRIHGDRYGDELRLAVAQLPDKTDMAAYDRVAGEVFARSQEASGDSGKSEFFRNAYTTTTQAHTTAQRHAFAQQQSAALVGVASDQLYEEVFGKIEISIQEGITQENLGQVLTEIGNNAVLNGMDGTLVNHTIVEAVSQAAIEMARRDPSQALGMLDILDHVQGGSGPLSRTRQGSSVINAAADSISKIVQRDYRFQAWQEQRELSELTADTYTTAIDEMLTADDPTTVDLAPYIAKLSEAGNASAASALLSVQNALSGGEFNTVETVYTALATRIWRDGDVSEVEVMNTVGARQLSMVDANNLISMIGTRKREDATGQSGTDPIFANALTDIARGFQDSLGVLGGLRGEQASKAEASLQWDYYRARDAGTFEEMDDASRAAWLRERASHWVEYYGGGKPIGQELKGATAQAFLGQENAWRDTVVMGSDQLNGLVLRLAEKALTYADLQTMTQLGVGWGEIALFISTQRQLSLETVTITNTQREAPEEGFAGSVTEG